ncbi:vWA domain-containing protein [Amycolatopsis sp. NPDC051045]|uniref:vWA domain-containing protein n=1 Tax=Amycolatopsis sp. NPDC051045 TaxID=3156922 RepID=UPI003435419E
MTPPAVAASDTHRLAVVPGGGPVSGTRIGVPEGAGAGPCVMSVRSGQGWLRTAVLTTELAEVPAHHVAVDDDLAADWDLDVADRSQWQLERVEPAPIRKIVLELPTERDPRDAAKDVARAGLVGELLWVPRNHTDLSVPVDGVPHRVRELDVGGQHGVVARITRSTVVELYAPAARAGVDVVVLADTSASMAVEDLPAGRDPGHGSGSRWITRIDALRESLRQLLEIRMQVSGRVSRFALLEFDRRVRHSFPKGGGMVQLDAGAAGQLVTDFRQATALMRPSGGTDIGNALHAAANLLYQHGRPGNDKLIVLVSDGANWVPKGEAGTGEVVHTVEEPVSLMAHFQRDLGIRLHAIGISTVAMYQQRGGDMARPELIPNHTLLGELVKVGGGDPTTIGGLDVVAEYFGGLGGGIIHRVTDRLTDMARPGPLPERTRAALRALQHGGTEDWDRHREELKIRIIELAGRCDTEFLRAHNRSVWVDRFILQLSGRELGALVTNTAGTAGFLLGVSRGLRPQQSDAPFAPLRALLDELAVIGEGGGADYARVAGLCGTPADSPAGTQVAVMRRLHDVLEALHRQLTVPVAAQAHAQRPVVPPRAAEPRRNDVPTFVYRD